MRCLARTHAKAHIDGRLEKVRGRYTFGKIRDGLSNTFFVGEKAYDHLHEGEIGIGDGCVYNGDAPNVPMRRAGVGFLIAKKESTRAVFGSDHSDICYFLLGDGSVKGIDKSIGEIELEQWSVRNNGR